MPKTSVDTLKIQDNSKLKPFHITNFTQLLNKTTKIGQKYMKFNGPAKEARHVRIYLRKASRAFYKQRLSVQRPSRDRNRNLTKEVNMLCSPLNKAADHANKLVIEDQTARMIHMKNRLMVPMHEVCQARHIPDQPIPKNALKLSLTMKKRLDILVGVADTYVRDLAKRNCFATKDHKAVNAATGEVMPHLEARNLTFVGSNDEYKKLMKLAKDNHITLK